MTSPVDPRLRRRTCAGVIGVGVALVLTASHAAAVPGARTRPAQHADAAAPRPVAVVRTAPAVPVAASSTAPAPVARKTRPRPKGHVPVKAQTDAKAISALAANGIPRVALNAYRVAAARLAHVQPGCGIDWALIAGIGRVESNHGRFRGAVLHTDGVSTPAIVGPALDGIHWEYFPVSTEYVRVTGDRTYAHALGPMQFIPTTWAAYAADADGDGKADVFDINDAALGTARYLCAAGGNLRTHAGQVAGVHAYNHSETYLEQVLALAAAYRRSVAVTGKPKGNTTGSLPEAKHGRHLPPVNPGTPTAVGKSGAVPGKPPVSTAPTSKPTAVTSPVPTPTAPPSAKPTAPKPSSPTPTRTPTPTKAASPSAGAPRIPSPTASRPRA